MARREGPKGMRARQAPLNRPRARAHPRARKAGCGGVDFCRPFSVPNPPRGCNSDSAQYSITPLLHHSAWPEFEDEDDDDHEDDFESPFG